jgi:hypothetical protein
MLGQKLNSAAEVARSVENDIEYVNLGKRLIS